MIKYKEKCHERVGGREVRKRGTRGGEKWAERVREKIKRQSKVRQSGRTVVLERECVCVEVGWGGGVGKGVEASG